MINLKNAAQYAFKNKDKLVKECSCYHCLNKFDKEHITQWTDQGQTAICPSCHVDAVLPGIFSDEQLKLFHDYWF